MKEAIRIGVIGCGDIALTQHIPAILQCKEADLAGLCDVHGERVRALAAQHGVPGYTDAKAMMRECEMDAVVVATPPWVTPRLTEAALKSGLDVLCEKPMALTLAEARHVAEVERETGRHVQLGFTYRHDPLLEQLRVWIKEDALGHPLVYRLGIYDEIWDPQGHPEHYARLYATMQHGCPSVHDGAHNADFLHFLTGAQVKEVHAFGMQSRSEFPCSNYDTSVIRFENGDLAKLEIGWLYPVLPYGEFEVLGPKGYASYDRRARYVRLTDGRETREKRDTEDWWRLCFKLQLEKFVSSVRLDRPCMPGCEEGIYSLRLCKQIEAEIAKNNGGDAK